MKKQGLGIIEIIVSLGLIALIVLGLNYMITKDFVTVRTPIAAVSNSETNVASISTTTPTASTTPTSTPAQVTQTPPAATSTPATGTSVTTSSGLKITFTDKGFSPASLAVKKGQTVTFVNNSSGKMWVAANPFPTSSEYPAFNEKSGVASGSSWSFTFDKTGTWFYHNHYSPAQGAKIVVNAK